ncbi:thiol:disulfide interchange protein DsbG [Marinobacter sp. TBZ242]|uniref:Thiol:disulfide interchange protein n=1 Tax=Marinobacter azerbaijanicus TaxID=3050455 RepID=A0ABT7IKX7_9GAMM|nr:MULTISPECIES: thiol:disulfide interchange protein DsbG [Gammaproteobacteria]MDL0433739.1 thiol:disulfide interchange protein DsbG [Marinobacter sp. TBZ242]
MSLRLSSSVLALAFVGAIPIAVAEEWPDPIQAIANQGLTIHGDFEAPSGLTGYAASYQGQEIAVYLTEDGKHAIVGNLVDAEGNNLSREPLSAMVRGPQDAEIWSDLEESHWVLDGDPDAPRVVYTITDPNCPYCKQLWQETRPWVEAGEVQLRHILVGILLEDSPQKALAILESNDPARALHEHNQGDTPPAKERFSPETEQTLYENHQLMQGLGLQATPSTFYQVEAGIEVIQGLPNDERLQEIMGGPAP